MNPSVRVPPGASPEQLEAAYARGLLRKEALQHGAYYEGHCRNTNVARWHAPSQSFLYIRSKFGEHFVESIRHPADERHYDSFAVTGPTEPTPDQTVSDAALESWGKPRD